MRDPGPGTVRRNFKKNPKSSHTAAKRIRTHAWCAVTNVNCVVARVQNIADDNDRYARWHVGAHAPLTVRAV